MSWYAGFPRRRRRDLVTCIRCGAVEVVPAYYRPDVGAKAGVCYACDDAYLQEMRRGWAAQRLKQQEA